MSARITALAKLRELPTWPDVVVLLDKVMGSRDERVELELLMTLLVLQAAENSEKRALDRVNGLVAELKGIVAEARQHLAAVQGPPGSDTKPLTSVLSII